MDSTDTGTDSPNSGIMNDNSLLTQGICNTTRLKIHNNVYKSDSSCPATSEHVNSSNHIQTLCLTANNTQNGHIVNTIDTYITNICNLVLTLTKKASNDQNQNMGVIDIVQFQKRTQNLELLTGIRKKFGKMLLDITAIEKKLQKELQNEIHEAQNTLSKLRFSEKTEVPEKAKLPRKTETPPETKHLRKSSISLEPTHVENSVKHPVSNLKEKTSLSPWEDPRETVVRIMKRNINPISIPVIAPVSVTGVAPVFVSSNSSVTRKYVSIRGNNEIKLKVIFIDQSLTSFEEIKAQMCLPELYYIPQWKHFAVRVGDMVFHANMGKIITNRNKRAPMRVKECSYLPCTQLASCFYYHDPERHPGSKDIRNYMADSWIYSKFSKRYATRYGTRQIGTSDSIVTDLRTISDEGARRFLDQTSHDILCSILIWKNVLNRKKDEKRKIAPVIHKKSGGRHFQKTPTGNI